jgi:hypothetical protein
MLRKIMLGVLAVGLPVGLLAVVVTPQLASASPAAKAGTGNYNCKKTTGTLTFSPPLTNTGTKAEKVTIKSASTGCTGGSPKVTKNAATATLKLSTNSCSGLAGGSNNVTIKLTYTNGASPSTYKAVSSGGITGSGSVQFTTTGTITGSYPSSSASSVDNIKQNATAIEKSCGTKAGLKSLTISSGTATNF